MGTTRIKVIDLSAEKKEIKTSRKHAERLVGGARLKEEKQDKKTITKGTEKGQEVTETKSARPQPSVPSESSELSVITPSVPSVIKTKSKVATHLRHRGKKYQQAAKLIDKSKSYAVPEALELLAKTSITSFDPTVEVHLNVADKNLKISVNFPHPVGRRKEPRYLIFSEEKPATLPRSAGQAQSTEKKHEDTEKKSVSTSKRSVSSVAANNIIWGDQSTIADIESGKLKPGRDFDACLAQPKFMPALAKIAKILGPRGLMPNPKNGTILRSKTSLSQDPQKAIGQKNDGAVNLALDPTAPILHTVIGKLSAKPSNLSQNLQALIAAVGPQKIKKATITTTMGPGIKVDIDSISAN